MLDGRAVTPAEAGRLRAQLFGWVFQTVNVLGRRSAKDNAMLGLLARGADRASAETAARDALGRVGLSGFESRLACSLSGGELQRLCIARALATRPRYLLADEPTGQLDRATTEEVTEALLSRPDPQSTIIVVTHDLRVAARCDLVLGIRDGRIMIGADI
ncbi:MAG: hypothetical protein Kow0010_27080 [Dehalococcoidia bacterium]